ncbi:hypothetical protein Q7A53_03365 [Halobacillus rhizosphaerae]|uniref:hypothetical protein n=1 Tax=Halobacillus rhizosphaerae TaxID=3064889 RepID=UPI00398AD1BB
MLLNIILGILIPWILCILLIQRAPIVVFVMFPIGISIAFLANDWGFDLFWLVSPTLTNPSLSALPYNVGYFPFLASLFAYFKVKQGRNSTLLVTIFSIITTSIEGCALIIGKVHYLNGWNILYTFLVYVTGFTIASLYLHLLTNYKILPK